MRWTNTNTGIKTISISPKKAMAAILVTTRFNPMKSGYRRP
jgi:hypothetical protein